MCGDLNCSLERIDRRVQNLDASRASFKELITYLKLDDIYRTKNGDKLCYTYANKSNSIQSRIDYILGSAYINGIVKKCYTQNVPKAPDHRAVFITIKLETNRGPGYWKLNNNILESVILRDKVRNVISSVHERYSDTLDKRLLWDYCKVLIKEECIRFSTEESNGVKIKIAKLENSLKAAQEALTMSNNTIRKQEINHEIQDLTKQIEHFYESREMGRKISARVQWLEQGERNTKYFLGLENKRQTNYIITSIQNESGKKVYKAEQILKETSRFYTQLYDSSNVQERDIDVFLSKLTVLHELTDEESSQCEGLSTENECRNALDKMSLNKSPGRDGLTVEFYRVFWEDIKLLVIDSFNEAFSEKELAETHNYSIIKLLFKKNNREE